MMNSKYTTVLQNLIDTNFDLGLKDYPIFDEAYRGVLNTKIKKHFAYREIGFETPGMFKHFLNVKMDEIMPLYNQFYLSQSLTFDPFSSFDMEDTNTKNFSGTVEGVNDSCNNVTMDGTTTTETSGTDHGSVISDGSTTNSDTTTITGSGHTETDNTETLLSVHSDTPQALLSQASIQGNNYASSADRASNTTGSDTDTTNTNTSNASGSGTAENETVSDSQNASAMESKNTAVNVDVLHGTNLNTITNVETYINRRHGNSGAKNFSEMLQDFRATFMNIDMKIIDELNELFMGVY